MDNFSKQSIDVINSKLDTRLDANETAFLERELTQIRAKTFDVQYGAIKGLSFVPLATDIAGSADTYSYKVYDTVGRARIGGGKDKVPPRVDVGAFEVTGKVYTIDDAYGWDILEMREAARLGIPLSEKKARAAKSAIDTSIDDMILKGKPQDDTSTNIVTTGLANAASVTVHGSAFTNWLAATDDDVYIDELNDFMNTQISGVAENESLAGNTLLLPLNRYLLLKTKRLGVDANMTVLKYMLDNNPGLTIQPWGRLQSVTAASKDRAIFYARNPMVLEGVVPLMFEQLPPQALGMEFTVNCFARCGGVKVYHPVAMRYRDWP
jgi:hypothetical protein